MTLPQLGIRQDECFLDVILFSLTVCDKGREGITYPIAFGLMGIATRGVVDALTKENGGHLMALQLR